MKIAKVKWSVQLLLIRHYHAKLSLFEILFSKLESYHLKLVFFRCLWWIFRHRVAPVSAAVLCGLTLPP